MTFVNIAVAISALAGGGGGKNGFAPRSDPKNGFAPRPAYGGVFDFFRGFLGVWAQEGIEMELGHFGSFPAMEKRPKMKKTLYIARFCQNTL